MAEVESFLSDFLVRTEPVNEVIARAAVRLRSRSKSLRPPDALVLATAAELGADEVLTGDASWARSGWRITVLRGD